MRVPQRSCHLLSRSQMALTPALSREERGKKGRISLRNIACKGRTFQKILHVLPHNFLQMLLEGRSTTRQRAVWTGAAAWGRMGLLWA